MTPGLGERPEPSLRDVVAMLVSGLAGARSMAIFTGAVGPYPAIIRDETPALTLVDDRAVDMRALLWRACGFQPVTVGQLPPLLGDAWVVRVRGNRVVAVDTGLGAGRAAAMGCDWVTDPAPTGEAVGDGRVPDGWVVAARDLGAVMLVSADLNLGVQEVDATALTAAVDAAAAAGRLLAGSARLDHRR